MESGLTMLGLANVSGLRILNSLIVNLQYDKDSLYNRVDLFVRLLAIDQYYGKNSYGFDLYEKMQRVRLEQVEVKKALEGREYSRETFTRLIQSFEKNGFDSRFPLGIDIDGKLYDGSHRLALSIYHKLDNIPVYIEESIGKFDCKYDLDWFLRNGFSKEELRKITIKMDDVLKSYSKEYILIIWGPALQYRSIVNSIIKEKLLVSERYSIHFDNSDKMASFIENIYLYDNCRQDRFIVKKEKLLNGPLSCEIYKVTFRNSYEIVSNKRGHVSVFNKEVEEVKNNIRKKISSLMSKDYYFDIVVHTTDNRENTDHVQNVIQRYKS